MMNPSAGPHPLGLVAGFILAPGLELSAMVCTRARMRVAEPQAVTVT